jgi:Family of unknown function (DUF5636)
MIRARSSRNHALAEPGALRGKEASPTRSPAIAAPTSASTGQRATTPAPHLQLLALQRAVGNRAVASLATTRLRSAKRPRSVMRQKRDLEAQYNARVEAEPKKKNYYRSYLDDFKRIQDLLHDVAKVREYLQVLSTAKAQEDIDAVLSGGEGAWAPAKPILLVNTKAFTPVLNKGQMFVDAVAPRHGVHAHRLQWNVISQDIAKGGYNHSAVDLFRESSRQWWRQYNNPANNNAPVTNGRYMWEQILDTTGDVKLSGFTSPEALTQYILEEPDTSGLAHLSKGIKAAEGSRLNLRNDRIKHYAASEHFKQLTARAEGDRQVGRDDKFVLEGWTYTGFIADAWVNPPPGVERPPRDQPVPTVAYRPGHDPESRPA